MGKSATLTAVLIVLGLGAGCQSSPPSSTATKPAEQGTAVPAASETQTGRMAFQKLFATARLWAPDALPFRLQSDLTQQDRGQGGRTAIWRAGFASASKSAIKTFTWSGSRSEDAPEFGISPSPEDSYSPSNSSTQVFEIVYLKVDSDQAYKVAQEHGGDKITAKDPRQPVYYVLDWDSVKAVLQWHVIYGTSPTDAKLQVKVNATTGAFAGVE